MHGVRYGRRIVSAADDNPGMSEDIAQDSIPLSRDGHGGEELLECHANLGSSGTSYHHFCDDR